MKKIIGAILTTFAIGALFTSMTKNKLVSVQGHIDYYGNAPFEQPAFKTDRGEVLAISVADEANFSLQELLEKQGYYLRLDGKIEKADLTTQPIGVKEKIIIYSYEDISLKGIKK
ncbi:MAG: hypothetical protein IJS09_05975 [Treponema sp.]|nr:hypothetical protein [Treponema sp.]